MLITSGFGLLDYFNFLFDFIIGFYDLFFFPFFSPFFLGNTQKKKRKRAPPAAPLPGGIRDKIQNNLSVTTGNKNDLLEGQSQPPPRSHRQRFPLLLSQGAEMPAQKHKKGGGKMLWGGELGVGVIFPCWAMESWLQWGFLSVEKRRWTSRAGS